MILCGSASASLRVMVVSFILGNSMTLAAFMQGQRIKKHDVLGCIRDPGPGATPVLVFSACALGATG